MIKIENAHFFRFIGSCVPHLNPNNFLFHSLRKTLPLKFGELEPISMQTDFVWGNVFIVMCDGPIFCLLEPKDESHHKEIIKKLLLKQIPKYLKKKKTSPLLLYCPSGHKISFTHLWIVFKLSYLDKTYIGLLQEDLTEKNCKCPHKCI